MKIYRGEFTYGRAPLGPHASCVHEVSRYGVHARRVRSQAHTANGSASYFHRRHQDTKIPWNLLLDLRPLRMVHSATLIMLRFARLNPWLTTGKRRACALLCCLALQVHAGASHAATLRAGVAKVDITPPAGLALWGYAERVAPATG